ncbi:hypothetical protein PVK06_007929 [Gossypium arboreum]|uniref:Aminotransferase-like plant mobile domain-containing protein n=1 Tax=Gossypium arboreum TaxID=29729 RepID=A0ABR0QIM3_GOSAR|nr:hypothetical protein PVK06_007929 [Gossypium arboreum]
MLRGTKLNPSLISALVERWRLEAHIFHLPCGECTIALENISLQLGLLVNGEVDTGPVISVEWSATCNQLLGKVSNKFRDSRIEMRWLEENLQTIEAFTSDIEKEQFTCAFILRLIRGLLMLDKSRNLVHLRFEDSRMHPSRIFGQSQHLECQRVIDSFCDGRDARIRSSDAAV